MGRIQGLFFILVAMLFAAVAQAAPKATATVSDTATRVGDPVTLSIEIEGEDRGVPVLNGLPDFDVTPAGQSQQTFIVPGRVRKTATYSYQLVPKREGTLTIPGIEVKFDTETISTRPITLKVGPPEDPAVVAELAFGEVTLTKPGAWVGEWVPARVDFYLSESAAWSPQNVGELKSDACLSLGYKQVDPQTVERGGKKYQRFSWTTVLVPSKAGKVSLGPVLLKTLVQRTDDKSPNYDPRSIFRGRRVGPVKEMTVSAPPVELDVKPLPVADRPKTFDGAIGKFAFEGSGTPSRVKVGEPVEMTLMVTGEGNFDRLSDPPLADSRGWQTYPGKKNFQSADESSLRGRMTFSIQAVPSEKKDKMPVFEFCYFDPNIGRYMTLRNVDAPLVVEGDAAPPPPDAAVQAPKKAPDDILPNKMARERVAVGFAPVAPPLAVAAVMAAPVPLIAAFVVWRRRRDNPLLAWEKARRREIAAARERILATNDRGELLDLTMRVLQLAAAKHGRGSEAAVDAGQILDGRNLADATKDAVRQLFAARAELVYAGGTADAIAGAERDRAIALVDAYLGAPQA